MSKLRQELVGYGEEPIIRSYSVTHPRGLNLPEHSYPKWGQLIYAENGTATVWTPDGVRALPRLRAVWIPAGIASSISVYDSVSFRSIYVRSDYRADKLPSTVALVNVRPLLRELIAEVCRRSILSFDVPRSAHLAAVVVDEIEAVQDSPLQLPIPREPRAKRAAEIMLAAGEESDPADGSIDSAAEEAGASVRTLQRLFLSDTGMRLGEWQRRARMLRAVRHLARGGSVKEAGQRAGYRSTSAFVAAFRRELAGTPGRFFGESSD